MSDLSAHCPTCGDIEELALLFSPSRFTVSSEYLDIDCDACEENGAPA